MKSSVSSELYNEFLETHERDAIALIFLKRDVLPWHSNVCGLPYLPKNKSLPLDENQNPMFMVTQLNFEDMPPLEGFPRTGLLQFFLSDTPGAASNIGDPADQKNSRTIYTPVLNKNPDELMSSEEYLKKIEKCRDGGGNFFDTLEKLDGVALEFKEIKMFPPPSSREGRSFFEKILKDDPKLAQHYSELVSGHWIGGYPKTSHDDPIENFGPAGFNTSLLHLDSDEINQLSWGDFGCANWYIESERLAKLDFSRVIFQEDS